MEGDAGILLAADTRVRAITPENLHLILTRDYWYPIWDAGLYRPVVSLSWLLNYTAGGNAQHPLAYHVVNFALHAGNVLLAWLLAFTVIRRDLRLVHRRTLRGPSGECRRSHQCGRQSRP